MDYLSKEGTFGKHDTPATLPDNSKANFDLHEIFRERTGVKPKVLDEGPKELQNQRQEPLKSPADDLRERFPGIISSPFIVKDRTDSKDGLTEAEKEAIAKRNRKPVRDNFTGQ